MLYSYLLSVESRVLPRKPQGAIAILKCEINSFQIYSRSHSNRPFPILPSLVPGLLAVHRFDDLKISPFRSDGVTFGTPTWIWAVVVDGDLYVRAYHGKNSSRYKSAVQQKAGRMHAAGMVEDVVFESVSGDLNNAIDEAYKAKYSSSPYLSPMVSERSREATIRIRRK